MMAKGRALLDKHGLHDWRFDVQNLRRKPGLTDEDLWGGCIPEKKLIVVDWGVGRNFRQTVLHEIAHALAGTPDHGREFLRVAKKIGCTFYRLSGYIRYQKAEDAKLGVPHDPNCSDPHCYTCYDILQDIDRYRYRAK